MIAESHFESFNVKRDFTAFPVPGDFLKLAPIKSVAYPKGNSLPCRPNFLDFSSSYNMDQQKTYRRLKDTPIYKSLSRYVLKGCFGDKLNTQRFRYFDDWDLWWPALKTSNQTFYRPSDDFWCNITPVVSPVTIKSFLPFSVAKHLSNYYCTLLDRGFLRCGDRDSPKRAWCHNDCVGLFAGHSLSPLMSKLTGKQTKLLFSNFVSYQRGARLPIHTDRREDVLSVSVQLAPLKVAYHPSTVPEWPLYTRTPSEDTQMSCQLGDAALFEGYHQPHWRNILNAERSNFLILHYVVG